MLRVYDGAVTFIGGTISKTSAVRERLLRFHVACRTCSCCALHVAHDGACRVALADAWWCR